MPAQQSAGRPGQWVGRVDQTTSRERVVGVAVVELLAKPRTDQELSVPARRDIDEGEEPVQIAPQRESVRQLVRATGRPRPDVRGFDGRQRMLAGYRTRSAVGVEHRET